VNNLWRRTVRPGIIFAGAIALLSAGPHTYEAFAQGGSIPLRGGIQQPPQQRPDQEAGTRLFKAPSGELFRVWTRRIDQVGSTVVLASSADGVTWRPLTQLQARDREANLQEAHLAINEAGDIALAYRWIGVQKIKHLRLARSIDAGKTWTVPTDNLDSTAGAFAPQVAWGTERTIVMAWPDEGATTSHRYDVYLRRSPDGGITWESPVVVTRYRQDGSSYKPHLSGDGRGRFWLAWIESRIGRRSALLLSRSEDNGRTWSPPQQVSGDTHSIVGQSLDLSSNGRLLLTWGAQRSEPVELPPRIYAASSGDGGVTWSQPVEVDGLAAQASTIALGHSSGLTASGEAWVAWYDNRNGRDDVFVARSPDGGLTWGTPFRLDADSPGTAQSLFPRLAVSPDGTVVAVVWQDDRSGLEAVYARIFSGRQWSEETLIGAAIPLKKASRAPQIVPTGKEGFYVTWEVSDYSQGPNPQQTLDSIVVRIR
jgi:BNR repeat-like domain